MGVIQTDAMGRSDPDGANESSDSASNIKLVTLDGSYVGEALAASKLSECLEHPS